MNKQPPVFQMAFLETQQYRLFTELCDACRHYHYIGICYGLPGVGKTFSARYYAQWEQIEPLLTLRGAESPPTTKIASCKTVLYTPTIAASPKQIQREVGEIRAWLRFYRKEILHREQGHENWEQPLPPLEEMDLLMVDETDRLKLTGIEQVRDIYDRNQNGMMLMGMPGLEKQLARYPQLYSRVGFVHEFRPLESEEVRSLLQRQWLQWGFALQPDATAEKEAIAAIIRITKGNFRLLHRLLTQIERIAQINGLRVVTKEVVEIARQQLVIGPD
jgi:DNA transposition AAA+ family ATPase